MIEIGNSLSRDSFGDLSFNYFIRKWLYLQLSHINFYVLISIYSDIELKLDYIEDIIE